MSTPGTMFGRWRCAEQVVVVGGLADAEREAALHLDDRRDRPAAEHPVGPAAAVQPAAAFAERQADDRAGHELVRRVERLRPYSASGSKYSDHGIDRVVVQDARARSSSSCPARTGCPYSRL